MNWSLKTATIRTQIVILSVVPMLVLAASTTLTRPLVPDGHEKAQYAQSLAGRLETVFDLARSAQSPADLDALLRVVGRSGLSAETLTQRELRSVKEVSGEPSGIGRRVAGALGEGGFDLAIRSVRGGAAARDVAVGLIDPTLALAITLPDAPAFPWIEDFLINLAVKIALLALPILLLAVYASRTIASPLTRFAREAETMSGAIERGRQFRVEGCREVVMLTTALNAMRGRIFDMLEDRKAMMRAISHDLRTPLTRLRMRAERCEQADLRDALLGDVNGLSALVDNCLLYITNSQQAETVLKVDLASMMQTICNDFSDMGIEATYVGPQRYAYGCRPQALSRAVSNLVANAARSARTIEIRLTPTDKGGIALAVVDDGPGIPPELRSRMIEPFAKGDDARSATQKSGFGLGLSIVDDIAKGHGGRLALSDNAPQGLRAELLLPAKAP